MADTTTTTSASETAGERRTAEERPAGGRRFARAHGEEAVPAEGVRARQREEFGGFHLGAACFGYLVAVGITVLLTGILSAAGAAIGLTETSEAEVTANAETIGLVGGILLLAVIALAYYAGGYVAGRLSRFDGGRQGLGVWVLGLLVAIALGVLGAVAGSEYNVVERAGLPALPVGEQALTTAGIIATVVILAGTLLAAMGGGKAGERYHRKVDRAGGLLD